MDAFEYKELPPSAPFPLQIPPSPAHHLRLENEVIAESTAKNTDFAEPQETHNPAGRGSTWVTEQDVRASIGIGRGVPKMGHYWGLT